MFKSNLLSYFKLILILITITLEVTCKFVWLKFALSPHRIIYHKTNYISPITFGYANFFPVIVFTLTCILMILIALETIKHLQLAKAIIILSAITSTLNIVPICIGQSKLNMGIIIITSLLLLIGILTSLLTQK